MRASPVHIWRAVTGGGLAVDFLQWQAAMWEQYVSECSPNLGEIEYVRADFCDWVTARFIKSAPENSA